ncbi:MAG: hypothetical protein IBX48_02410 [Thiomicrospira sp.]|uniref:hypothetical protein n=1 Tax=Thiomicrospira sp. TaxID=935 RepID=UPI0019DBA162|nr:hypothetical protein [Thiomicrospira sp.]MBE0493170.1 hypothetical protein [Thiomicrospira sp.]
MRTRLDAIFISQQVQKNGFWLIKIELSQFTELAIGTRFIHELNQAWLFQKQSIYLTLLSQTDWQNLQAKQVFSLELMPSQLAFNPQTPQVWLGSELSQAAVFDAAKRWQQSPKPKAPMMALLHAQHAFMFQPKPAKFLVNINAQVIGAAPLLEDWGIANRLASTAGLPGSLEGDLADLYQAWLLAYQHQAWSVFGFLPKHQYQACLKLNQAYPNIDYQVQPL